MQSQATDLLNQRHYLKKSEQRGGATFDYLKLLKKELS